MKSYRCPRCGKRLFDSLEEMKVPISIQCGRCKTLVVFNNSPTSSDSWIPNKASEPISKANRA